MTRRSKLWVGGVLALALFVSVWLFVGVYRERKSGAHYLFVKHQPTFKVSFYAPLGESDRTLNELDPQQSHEEVMYREYVEEHGGSRRSISLGW